MDLYTILDNINKAVEEYNVLQLNLVRDQSEILRGLTTNLYFLEKYRIEAYETWQSVYFQSKGTSGAAKEREADFKVPELYKIRRITEGGYKVVDSIRSTISIYKKES